MMNRIKWTRFTWILAFIAIVGLSACETDQVDVETESPEMTTAPATDVQALQTEIDSRLEESGQYTSELSTQVANLPESEREEIESLMEKIGEEKQDLLELRQQLNTAATPEETARIEREVWAEFRDLDVLETEARMRAAADRTEFNNVLASETAEFDQEIQELEAEGTEMSAEAQQEHNERITQLRQQREDFQQNLDQFEQSTEENWQDMRNDLIQGWRNIKESFYDIRIPDVDVDVNTPREPISQ